jgi:tRNA threonylcarbamoyladenosine biosynthesis protein TsaE
MSAGLTFSFRCDDLQSLEQAARALLAEFQEERVFALYGEMGAGKTTFVKALCKVLGCTDQVTSPTFTLVNEYRTADDEPVYHFDLYRIKSEAEVYDFGFEDYLYSGCYCFIEWPEKAPGAMTGNEVQVKITPEGATRIISAER